MKKLIVTLIALIILFLLSIYVFIPSKIKIEAIATANTNAIAAHRLLMNDTNWHKWWPSGKPFQFGDASFKITKKMLNGFDILINNGNDSTLSTLQLIPTGKDALPTLKLEWKSEVNVTGNPFDRIMQFRKAVSLKKDMKLIIDSLRNFLSKQENVYGFNVKLVKVTDSVLISTRKSFDHYPNAFEIDEMIKTLRNYIHANQAKEMNFPMLHVQWSDSSHFEAMTAIATDIELPDTKEFAHKMLLKGGNLLEAEIRGGYWTIKKAFEEYENFIEENSYTSPAIPYELLITDRTKETDTTKWVTKVCYPVF